MVTELYEDVLWETKRRSLSSDLWEQLKFTEGKKNNKSFIGWVHDVILEFNSGDWLHNRLQEQADGRASLV